MAVPAPSRQKECTMKQYDGFAGYATMVAECDVLENSVVDSLMEQYRKDNDRDALDKVVKSVLKLVIKIANEYKGRAPVEDLVASGNAGVMKAVKKYSQGKGAKFSSYAAWWIRSEMKRSCIDGQYIVRQGEYHRVKKGKRKFISSVSLEMPVSEDSTATFGDFLEYDGMDPYQEALENERRETAANLMAKMHEVLSEVECQVLCDRFGMNDGERKLGQQEIAERLGYTHQQISNIEKRGLEKMRKAMCGEREDCDELD